MLGRGSKFIQEGITAPKPLIKIRNRYMIEWALDPLRFLDLERDAIFIISKQHSTDSNLRDVIKGIIGKDAHIKAVEEIPQGAAKTVLLLRKEIDSSEELIIYNSDQLFRLNLEHLLKKWHGKADGIIPYFQATHPKWSYVETNEKDVVIRTAEKEVITNKATVGLYYFRHGKDFVWGADQMIKKNLMVNGEFYVCPVYNELISKGRVIKAFQVDEMWSFGTPEDVEKFERYYKGDL